MAESVLPCLVYALAGGALLLAFLVVW
jgi:hypothetical protein